MADLSAMMGWLQGTYAGDRNRRTSREGALWRGRFRPTLVETGTHLRRCLFYLDMNMVRAGVVAHPRDWRFGGYQEPCGARQRYRIIDQDHLLKCLAMQDQAAFRQWHEATLEELCGWANWPREPHWGYAFAVGGRHWVEQLTNATPSAQEHIRTLEPGAAGACDASCALHPPQSLRRRLWQAIAGGGGPQSRLLSTTDLVLKP